MHTTSHAQALPSWGFDSRWEVLPGLSHGLRQPVMLGSWSGDFGAPNALAPLEPLIAALIGDTLPERPACAGDVQSLVHDLLFWANAAQRHFNVPVFEPAQVWPDLADTQRARLGIALPYVAPQASWAALHWAGALARRSIHDPDTLTAELVAAQFEQLGRSLQPFRVSGYNAFRFLQAAHAMDIPARTLVDRVHAYGQGRHTRWLESSYTQQTPVIGTRLARDKFRTAQVLRQLGLPAPVHGRVASAAQAVELAGQLGYPVVVKPADRDGGLGVSADLRNEAAVLDAYRNAAQYSNQILVEKHADGDDHRLTVLHGRLIKTVLMRPFGVTGDGQRSIAQLLAEALPDQPHTQPALDHEALGLLEQYGMTGATVLAPGQQLALRRRANMAAGGTPILVEPARVHPDNRRLAERAAAALGLDLAGIDLIVPDISRSWFDTGALICEVNGQPQLGARTTPGIYADVLRQLLPPVTRIPVVLVVGVRPPDGLQIGALSSAGGSPWGYCDSVGAWQDRERLCRPMSNSFATAQLLVANREVGGVTVVMEPGQILASGLPFDRIDLLVLADTGGARLSSGDLDTLWRRRILPHVTGAMVATTHESFLLPDPALLHAQGQSIRFASAQAGVLSDCVRRLSAT